MLNYRFDEIRMKDGETFDEIYYFYAKLNDIVNCNFNIGEKIPEQRIVRKVMRSLPERFRPKVIAIEESKDLDCVKIEELVGSLETYELTLPHPKNKRFRKIFKPRKSDRKEIHHHKGYINNFTHSK
jgi:hypothetical protein